MPKTWLVRIALALGELFELLDELLLMLPVLGVSLFHPRGMRLDALREDLGHRLWLEPLAWDNQVDALTKGHETIVEVLRRRRYVLDCVLLVSLEELDKRRAAPHIREVLELEHLELNLLGAELLQLQPCGRRDRRIGVKLARFQQGLRRLAE